MRLTDKQRRVLALANHRYNILSGATRSGKTYVSYLLIFLRLQEHIDHNILLCGKTLSTLERNVLEPMRGIYGTNIVGPIYADASGNRMVDICGKTCYCVGANDDRAQNKIRGLGLGYAYCDEVVTYPETFWQMLGTRLDEPGAKCDATCNPESPSHYIKRFVDSAAERGVDLYCEQFTIYDNTFLPPDLVRQMEAQYRGTVYFDRWILGQWVKTEGLVYPLFRRSRHYLTPEAYAARYGIHRVISVIWGGDGANTNDATAIEPLAVMDNGQAVTLEPFYHDPKINGQLSNAQLLPYIDRYLSDLDRKYHFTESGVTHYMPVDCAAADLVLTLAYNLPQRYNVQKYTKKDILGTVDVVNNALSRDAIVVLDFGGYYNYVRGEFVAGTRQLVTDLESMVWDEHNKGFDDRVPNDAADAWRYAVATYYQNPFNLWDTPTMTDNYGGNNG